MNDKILRKLFLGFIQVHILHHAARHPFFGSWMITELMGHGYQISAGSLYPLLHTMEAANLLQREDRLEEGKIRKYYTITQDGLAVLEEAKKKAGELFREISE